VKGKRGDDLEQKYVQVSTAIKNGSWKAIYAKTDAEFASIVRDMTAQAKAFGYDECVAWDREQGRIRATAVRRALE
jgi:multiple sugar transport system substrate-binding protein/putative aldouronate transport system substrate-binding protein